MWIEALLSTIIFLMICLIALLYWYKSNNHSRIYIFKIDDSENTPLIEREYIIASPSFLKKIFNVKTLKKENEKFESKKENENENLNSFQNSIPNENIETLSNKEENKIEIENEKETKEKTSSNSSSSVSIDEEN